MSDDSKTIGEVTVTPPLKWSEIKHSDFITQDTRESGRKSGQSVYFDITVVKSETDEGEKTVKTCSSIVPVRNGHGASGYLVANMKEIIQAHPGHSFEGEFITYPETGMLAFPTRVLVSGIGVVEQTAAVTWLNAK